MLVVERGARLAGVAGDTLDGDGQHAPLVACRRD
jgi:hypothetical protein